MRFHRREPPESVAVSRKGPHDAGTYLVSDRGGTLTNRRVQESPGRSRRWQTHHPRTHQGVDLQSEMRDVNSREALRVCEGIVAWLEKQGIFRWGGRTLGGVTVCRGFLKAARGSRRRVSAG